MSAELSERRSLGGFPHRLYRMTFDLGPDQWFLGAPVTASGEEIDPRIFTAGKPVWLSEKLTVPVGQVGTSRDFSFGSFDMPVVTSKVGVIVRSAAPGEIQQIPVAVQGRDEPYEILNVLCVSDCIDRAHTAGTFWAPADNRPDKVGQYRMITKLWLDPSRVDHKMFRVEGWRLALVVVAELKAALEAAEVTGLRFVAVS